MFNENLKQEFIDQYTDKPSRKRYCEVLFNATEPFENVWGADICTKDGKNLQRVVNNVLGIRYNAKSGRLNVLREYFKWCMENGVPGACNGIADIETDGTEKMRSRTVSSPLHLQMYLDGVFQKEQQQTRDNLVRAYCWLAYMGLPEEDIINLKNDEVDLKNMIVTHDGREYRIYAEAVACLRNCKELPSFYYRHPLYPDKAYPRDRVPGDLLLRGTGGEVSAAVLRNDMSRASKKKAETAGDSAATKEEKLFDRSQTLRLSYHRLWISGLFYRTFLMEGAGIEPDFAEASAERLEAKQYGFSGKSYNKRTLYNKFRQEYLEDYKMWKQTFYQ